MKTHQGRTQSLLFVLILVGVGFHGCASAPKQWYRSGGTPAQFEHDKEECENALLQTGTTGFQTHIYTFEECMEAKGWSLLDAPPS